jgi:hypothetical protein
VKYIVSLGFSALIVLTNIVLKELPWEPEGWPPDSGLSFQYNTRLSSVYSTDEIVFVEFRIETLFVNRFGIVASDAASGFAKFIVSLGLNEPIELTYMLLNVLVIVWLLPPIKGLLFQYSTRLVSAYSIEDFVFVELFNTIPFVNSLPIAASDA